MPTKRAGSAFSAVEFGQLHCVDCQLQDWPPWTITQLRLPSADESLDGGFQEFGHDQRDRLAAERDGLGPALRAYMT